MALRQQKTPSAKAAALSRLQRLEDFANEDSSARLSETTQMDAARQRRLRDQRSCGSGAPRGIPAGSMQNRVGKCTQPDVATETAFSTLPNGTAAR